MQRGLGRCIIRLQQTEHPEKYHDIILWGCRHNLAYDTQSEGTRSPYLYEMIQFYPDKSLFIETVKAAFRKTILKRDDLFTQSCRLLEYFAQDGFREAYAVLRKGYQELYQMILTGKVRRNRYGRFPAQENLEELCISLVRSEIWYGETGKAVTQRAERLYIRIVSDLGALCLQKGSFADETFEWFQACMDDSFGEKHALAVLRKQAEISREAAKYLGNLQTAQRRREEYRRQNRENNRQRAESYPDLADRRNCCQDADCLIRDAESNHTDLREAAFAALRVMQGEAVRRFALALYEKGERPADVVCMLASNYRKEDSEIIVTLVKRIPITYSNDADWHGVFGALLDLFNQENGEKLPRELLPYMYENGLCSFCREYILMRMEKAGMLTGDILEECMYDCNEDIREYAKKKLHGTKRSKA